MLRGTRLIVGKDAVLFNSITDTLRSTLLQFFPDFNEVIVPAIWEEETFLNKVGTENENMMWRFKDKGDRNVCLIPEVTGIFQEIWKNDWSKRMSKQNIFYVARCYRYEKPQAGRYREFTQFGIEMLGCKDSAPSKLILQTLLNSLRVDYTFNESVKRGLNYYVQDGFEAAIESLGAQKQIAGGGLYEEGCGFAIGVDRVMLALKNETK